MRGFLPGCFVVAGVVAVGFGSACGSRRLQQPDGGTGGGSGGGSGGSATGIDAAVDRGGAGTGGVGAVNPRLTAFIPGGERSLDVLFMIDNSGSMVPLQQQLITNFSAFINPLEQLPGGIPNLHLGIISSSMGAGIYSDVDGCFPETLENDDGAFHTIGRNPAGCSGLSPGQKFIIASSGSNNFANPASSVAQVFSCLALLGSSGCSFEHPFYSIQRALERGESPNDPNNGGFLRSESPLAIVMLTNEDDCSAPGSDLFNPSQTSNADPLGGLQTGYRCIEFGYLCNGQKPPRSISGFTPLTDCVSAEDRGRLISVRAMADFIKSFKRLPSQIFVGALAGPTTSVAVELMPNIQTSSGTRESQPAIAHSCSIGDVFADPGIRVAELVRAFGPTGFIRDVCSLNAALMNELGQAVARFASEDGCIDTAVPMRPDGTPDCSAREETLRAGSTQVTDLPSCSTGTFPCWRIASGVSCTARFAVCRDAACSPTRPPDPATADRLYCAFR
jgi:hypothetical protein